MRVLWIALSLMIASGSALAQSISQDVGLVNLLSGEVDYAARSAAIGKAQAFMRVREGDRFTVRPERRCAWSTSRAPARSVERPGELSCRTDTGRADLGSRGRGRDAAASVPKRIARVPELLQNAKLGGVQVRSAAVRAAPRTPEDERQVAEARATYAQMRAQAGGDDIAPELFLYAALSEYSMYPEMKAVVDEMQRRLPGSEHAKSLAAWLESRLKR